MKHMRTCTRKKIIDYIALKVPGIFNLPPPMAGCSVINQ